jgi:hypothetical protein
MIFESVCITIWSSRQRSSSISREDLASAVHLPDFGSSGSSSAAQIASEVQDGGPGRPPENREQLLEGDWMLVALPTHRAVSVLT